VQDERFLKILGALTTAEQMKRIGAAVAALDLQRFGR
jgi:hypothetical protein